MTEVAKAVQAALDSSGPIPRDRVVEWCRNAEDTGELELLCRLTDHSYDRIQPPLGQDETCDLIRKYLLRCIQVDPQDDQAFSRYEAARALAFWFWDLSEMGGTTLVLRDTAAAVRNLYLGSDAAVRIAIETGFLEHVLEDEQFRPLFADWARDDRLRESWEAALAWGKAHPGFTRRTWEGPDGPKSSK